MAQERDWYWAYIQKISTVNLQSIMYNLQLLGACHSLKSSSDWHWSIYGTTKWQLMTSGWLLMQFVSSSTALDSILMMELISTPFAEGQSLRQKWCWNPFACESHVSEPHDICLPFKFKSPQKAKCGHEHWKCDKQSWTLSLTETVKTKTNHEPSASPEALSLVDCFIAKIHHNSSIKGDHNSLASRTSSPQSHPQATRLISLKHYLTPVTLRLHPFPTGKGVGSGLCSNQGPKTLSKSAWNIKSKPWRHPILKTAGPSSATFWMEALSCGVSCLTPWSKLL